MPNYLTEPLFYIPLVGCIGLFIIVLISSIVNCYYQGTTFAQKYLQTKNITYLAVMIAMSVSLTIIGSVLLPAMIVPVVKISFQGLILKITGLLFGPLLGAFAALTSDLLVIMFIPVVIHPIYMTTIILVGFFSGLTSFIINMAFFKKSHWNLLMSATILIATVMIIATLIMFFWYGESNMNKNITVDIAGEKTFQLTYFILIFNGNLLFLIICAWCSWLFFKKTNKLHLLNSFIAILILCWLNEFIGITITSGADAALFKKSGGSTYQLWAASRFCLAPIKIFVNISVVFTTYLVVTKSFKNRLVSK